MDFANEGEEFDGNADNLSTNLAGLTAVSQLLSLDIYLQKVGYAHRRKSFG